ncbi:MAG: S8 family serine peptidase, partial [Candidatus Electryoneaceae bacterium]|nr:S8 family serine peptidase [Candidatus Electryoneaceae bacterium]
SAFAGEPPPLGGGSPTGRYWLFLEPEDLSAVELDIALDEVARNLTPRSLDRRRRVINREPPVRRCDLPISRHRIEMIETTGCRVIRTVRYLNAVSVLGSPLSFDRVDRLDFVRSIEPVMAFTVTNSWEEGHYYPSDEQECSPSRGMNEQEYFPVHGITVPIRRDDPEDYNATWVQASMVNVPAVHDLGYRGDGVLIGFQDTGFDNLDHRCFRNLDIVAAYDFLNGDDNVADQGDRGRGQHGTMTLSVVAGLDSGRFIGTAPDARFVLTKTEDTEAERPIEEDIWVEGLWFHDSIGVDVLSSSLSYREWYDYEDRDGRTAVTTRAADSAAAAGMVIVNSVGNTGQYHYPDSKIGVPSDGNLVIGAGGVTSDSSYWVRSSQGPTYDGRIKPDVVALSSRVYVASNYDDHNYYSRNGTSFSCPMIAGIAALMLDANPHLTPEQVIAILHETASDADDPDTLTGYGIVNALDAVRRAEQFINDDPGMPQSSLLLTAYPNPFNGRLTVVFGTGFIPRTLEIYDVNGRLYNTDHQWNEAVSLGHRITLDLNFLPTGTYFLRAGDGGMSAVKMVVLLR